MGGIYKIPPTIENMIRLILSFFRWTIIVELSMQINSDDSAIVHDFEPLKTYAEQRHLMKERNEDKKKTF